MRLLPHPRSSRFLAVTLFLITVSLVYLLGIHWGFVAPKLELHAQMNELREQQLRFHQTSQQRAQIEKRLAEVRSFEQNNQAFLPVADDHSAFSDLNQRLKQAVTAHAPDSNRCTINGISNQSTGRSAEEETYQRVSIQVSMRCDLEPFADILYDLENSNPYLFVDQLMIYKQQQRGRYLPPGSKQPQSFPSYLDIRFSLSGYLRQTVKKAKL